MRCVVNNRSLLYRRAPSEGPSRKLAPCHERVSALGWNNGTAALR